MQPDVTIVLTSYNQAMLVEQAVRMLSESNFTDRMELLIVDDASEVGVLWVEDVCRRASRTFPSVRLLRFAENRGVSEARNVGLAEATGRYVNFHDGDDLWLDGWSESVERMDAEGLTMLVTGLRPLLGTAYPTETPGKTRKEVHPMFHFPLDDLPHVTPVLVRADVKTRFRVAPTRPTSFWLQPPSGEDVFFVAEVANEGPYARTEDDYRILRDGHHDSGRWHGTDHLDVCLAAFKLLRHDLFSWPVVDEAVGLLSGKGLNPYAVAAVLEQPFPEAEYEEEWRGGGNHEEH